MPAMPKVAMSTTGARQRDGMHSYCRSVTALTKGGASLAACACGALPRDGRLSYSIVTETAMRTRRTPSKWVYSINTHLSVHSQKEALQRVVRYPLHSSLTHTPPSLRALYSAL